MEELVFNGETKGVAVRIREATAALFAQNPSADFKDREAESLKGSAPSSSGRNGNALHQEGSRKSS